MNSGIGWILAAVMVAMFCGPVAGRAALTEPSRAPVVSAAPGEIRTAQSYRRYRELKGRQRHIQQFRETPPRRDNDRYLRQRRDDTREDFRFRRDQRRSEQDRALDAVRRGQVLPLSGIIHSVEQFCPGTFLGATLHERGNGFAYRVTILRPNGRRLNLLVDAQLGTVLRGRCN